MNPHGGQSTGALPHGGAAADQADGEEQCAHHDDNDGRDQRVHILEEVVVVIVRDEHVGADVAQYPRGRLYANHGTGYYEDIKMVQMTMLEFAFGTYCHACTLFVQ